MKVLIWNCRSIESKWTINYSRKIWWKHKSVFFYLYGNKKDFEFVQGFQSHFGYDNLITVDPVGRSDGLALFYNNEYQINFLYFSNQMIDVEAVTLGKRVFPLCLW